MLGKYLLLGALFLTVLASAQSGPTGRIRGTVTDAASGQPLAYVAVAVGGGVSTVTDEKGMFELPPLAVGRHNIEAQLLGYEPASVREAMVSSARETVLDIALRQSVRTIDEVVVRPRVNKQEAVNAMALAGARMLSVEEASRYAGGMDDPARLAASFAGAAGSVASNSIAIRGNSPQFLQWKLEGVEIPNPSHYPEIGAVGGGILTAFSSHVLGNSDFFTGAFPAQYNNALSGVFDMALRNGNNRKHEHTASLGTLGVEFGSEGPFRRGKQASYLFNYRYSSMALASDLMGGSLEEVSGMRYQDLSFKVNLPTRRAGTFSLWGIATNDSYLEPEDRKTDYQPSRSHARQWMAAAGLGHRVFVGANSYLKTTLAATHAYNHILHDYLYDAPELVPVADLRDRNTNLILSSFLNTKFGARHTNRTGATLTGLFYDDNYNIAPDYPFPTGPIANFADARGNSMMVSAFSQSVFQLSDRLTAEVGVTGQYFALNGHWTVEPRAALRWQAAPHHSLAVAAGLHSRHERLDYYFVADNRLLDFARAAHVTASWDWRVSDNVHLRLEPYFQYLHDVPVVPGTSTSIINQSQYFMNDPLINGGLGRNIGVDLTLERYLKDGWYYMLTASLFDSRYTGSDGVWHDTRHNRRFVANALAGKEWMLGRRKRQVLGVSLRANVMGGDRFTPLDEAASLAAGRPIEDESRVMEGQNPASVVLHATVNYQFHARRVVHEVGFKMINLTGSQAYGEFDYNLSTHRFDHLAVKVGIPNVYYKIAF